MSRSTTEMTHPHLEGLIHELPPLPERAASYHVSHFRQVPGMRNTEFQEAADFTEGAHSLYTAEQMREYAKAALAALPGGGVEEFPMLDGPPIPMALARSIFAAYTHLYGGQTLERIGQRGGFGWAEVPHLWTEYQGAMKRAARLTPTPNPHEAEQ